MSIMYLCRRVSKMKTMQDNLALRGGSRETGSDSILLFLFFLLGLGVTLLGNRFLPRLTQQASDRMSVFLLILPSACALLAGSTILGLYLIPSSSLALGALVGLFVVQSLEMPYDEALLFSRLLSAAAAVPAFFMIGALGMRNASALLLALRLSGRRAERDALRVFASRWVVFAGLLLCFFFLHGSMNR